MTLSTSVKLLFWALLVTLATCYWDDEEFSDGSREEDYLWPLLNDNIPAGISSGTTKRPLYDDDRGFSDKDKTDLLNYHNKFRTQMIAENMLLMHWDSSLETLAQTWSDKCSPTIRSQEERTNVGGFDYVGENRFIAKSTFDILTAVQKWYDEGRSYNYDTNTCTPVGGCENYIQIVWAESAAVGCGITFCDNKIDNEVVRRLVMTCNYGPGANSTAHRPYEK